MLTQDSGRHMKARGVGKRPQRAGSSHGVSEDPFFISATLSTFRNTQSRPPQLPMLDIWTAEPTGTSPNPSDRADHDLGGVHLLSYRMGDVALSR